MAETKGALGQRMTRTSSTGEVRTRTRRFAPEEAAPAPAPIPEPTPSEPIDEMEAESVRLERALGQVMGTENVKSGAASVRDGIRQYLYNNCQLSIKGDSKSGEFAQRIRDGIDFPGVCTDAAKLELLTDRIATGEYAREDIRKLEPKKRKNRTAEAMESLAALGGVE